MAKARPITGLNPQDSTGKNAREIARVRLEELYSWESFVDNPYNIAELHNMRIAAKRLRYTFEVFEDALPTASKTVLKELVQLQEELGDLHDSDVMIALLRLCLSSHDTTTLPERMHLNGNNQQAHQKSLVSAELIADLLDPTAAPSVEERYGMEHFLQSQEQLRNKQYDTFRQHWYTLQAQDFKRQVQEVLDM
jgi:CHAD domain